MFELFNNLNLFYYTIIIFIFSFAIDVIYGEIPGKIHPVVLIGNLISELKNILISIKNKFSGFLLFVLTSIISSVILYVIYILCSFNSIILFIVFCVILSSTYSVNLLLKTATDVKNDLENDIDKARKSVSYLVSRNTNELSENFIVSAVIESLTENITDSYVAPVFYYFIFALVILTLQINDSVYYLVLIPIVYRISNTLDAMVGYKTDELKEIGYFPAKVDDILNYIPSRIAGIFVVISAYLLKFDGKNSFNIMMRDARNCPSPNSGYTMASTAGALNIQLIKKDTYILGDDNKNKTSNDISKAVNLSKLIMILFTIFILVIFTLIYVIL